MKPQAKSLAACVSTLLTVALAAGCVTEDVKCVDDPTLSVCEQPDATVDTTPPVDAGPCGTCFLPTPLCLADAGTCVECLTTPDCAAATASTCDPVGRTCEPCATSTDCVHISATPTCDTSGVAGVCVECAANDDCLTATAGRCDTATNTCGSCVVDTDCAHLTATPVCDEAGGSCVACTPDSEATTCPAPDNFACDPTLFTCTGAARGSLGFCHTCISDSECLSDVTGALRCVPMQFMEAAHGNYCLLDLASHRAATMMPMAGCPNRMPTARMAISQLGMMADYCFVREALTTCEAVVGFASAMCTSDTECGDTGLSDALCRTRCTYGCSSMTDCGIGVACTGAGTTYCNPN